MLKDDIENIVSSACDGTWNGLERATFVWNSSPQKLADKLVAYIERLLTQRAVDVATPCANCTQPESNHPNRMCDVFCPPRN